MVEKPEDKWPSVHLAYEFVKPSYDWLQNRLDAVNHRIEFLLTFSCSITVATPIFVKALFSDIDFGSLWFMAAIGVFVLTAIVGIVARMTSGIKLISPERLYAQWLSWSEWEFKKNAIYWAGEHFKYNVSLVNKKANFALVMSALLVLEVMFIVLWAAWAT